MRFAYLLLILSPVAAYAQTAQPQQQISPSEVALQIDGAVNNLAMAVTQLQKQLETAQTRVRELEAKCGDACKETPK